MTPHSPLGILDANTLEELARVICGDEHLYYRKGYEIARFLEHAGWQRVPEYDGEYRREWALARLTERREDPTELERVLLRLADPREYLDEPEQLSAVISAVNAFLIHEGVRLENPGGRPRLVACDPSLAHPGSQGPVELRATMTDLITDQNMAGLLQHRLDETHTCYANGAHVAAIIMLGSLLEGVLVHVVHERDTSLLGRTSPRQGEPGLPDQDLSRRRLDRGRRRTLLPRVAQVPQLRPSARRDPGGSRPGPRHPGHVLARGQRGPERPRRLPAQGSLITRTAPSRAQLVKRV
ncbi:hypothetical protein ABTX77_26560 [Streptomyces sp. NPDC097704]|uniref:hypothetical protein n=1 Tax=Streptomyces sp. NPDC097704 TaxID=3157101 RepID=UPI00331C30B4